jgi:integrase
MALVRAAASEQDAAIYLTAASTGLRRGELVALRWRDVDFVRRHVRVTASYTERSLTTPKSGKIRSVPLAPVVGEALARLGQRDELTGEDDLVFPGIAGTHLDASALYRRYKTALQRAGLRNLRFHDLRRTFGTQVIGNPRVSILQLKEWMGHADTDTTMKYLHFARVPATPTWWARPLPLRRPEPGWAAERAIGGPSAAARSRRLPGVVCPCTRPLARGLSALTAPFAKR